MSVHRDRSKILSPCLASFRSTLPDLKALEVQAHHPTILDMNCIVLWPVWAPRTIKRNDNSNMSNEAAVGHGTVTERGGAARGRNRGRAAASSLEAGKQEMKNETETKSGGGGGGGRGRR